MKIIGVFFAFSFIIISSTFSQNEANIWYFGKYAGLDFTNGDPVAISDNYMWTREGCATICNSNGKLLFYTDGRFVWNNSHEIMPNGKKLTGDSYTTQSAIIVPRPGASLLYYIFTLDNVGGPDGLKYSLVDMSLSNAKGQGDVIQKNVTLMSPMSEKLTATKHSNGTDYWVVAHEVNGNNFISYRVNKHGVSSAPVFSTVGSSQESSIIGYLKISPDGTKIASALYKDRKIEIFKFDNSTGRVTEPISVSLTSADMVYGLEFSLDGTKLYATGGSSSCWLYQLDLSSYNQPDVVKSLTTISKNTEAYVYAALQMGPNGKIYVGAYRKNAIHVINNPDALGTACNFVENDIHLKSSSMRLLGMPNYVSSFFGDPCSKYGFNYPEFIVSEGLELKGSTKILNNAVELTPPELQKRSALWYDKAVPINTSFTSEFAFRMSEPFNGFDDGSKPGADGLAFVIQAEGPDEIGKSGGGIGYRGIFNSLAIEFDTDKNATSNYNDPDGNHVAVFHNYETDKTAGHGSDSEIATNTEIMDLLADNTKYFVRIVYNKSAFTLSVYLDKTGDFKESSKVISLSGFDIADYIYLDNNFRGYIGFTSSMGTSYERHEILSWNFCPHDAVPATDVEDGPIFISKESFYAYPNPAVFSTRVSFTLDIPSNVNLCVYNSVGRQVEELSAEFLGAGRHEFEWNT